MIQHYSLHRPSPFCTSRHYKTMTDIQRYDDMLSRRHPSSASPSFWSASVRETTRPVCQRRPLLINRRRDIKIRTLNRRVGMSPSFLQDQPRHLLILLRRHNTEGLRRTKFEIPLRTQHRRRRMVGATQLTNAPNRRMLLLLFS